MKLESLFTKEVVVATPKDTIRAVARLMKDQNVGTVVITEQQRPVGIVTDRDVALALAVDGYAPSDAVQKLMTCPVTTISQHEGVFDATKHMMESALRRLPVVDDLGRVVGIVSLDDLFLLLAREMGNLAEGVKREVTPAMA